MYLAIDTKGGECEFAAITNSAGADFISGPPTGCETMFSFCGAAARSEPLFADFLQRG
jgi:hypothetical protein